MVRKTFFTVFCFLGLQFTLAATGLSLETNIAVRVRDSADGHGLKATVILRLGSDESQSHVYEVPPEGKVFPVPRSIKFYLDIRAPNYHPLTTHFTLDENRTQEITVWLDPVTPPKELDPTVIQSQRPPGYTLIHGHVTRTKDGIPIKGAKVETVHTLRETFTDSRGYFLLLVPASKNPETELPEVDDLRVSLSGYKTYVIQNFMLLEGDIHFLIDLEPGVGTTGRDDRHPLYGSCSELAERESLRSSIFPEGYSEDWETYWPSQGIFPVGKGAIEEPLLLVHDPPDSIRVGSSCSCTSCSVVNTYSLETYTKRGLNDEWIASWHTHSLRSGAIPYRSYGAYYVYHPISSSYDICNNTCCQVNDSDTSTATDTAVNVTAGILLQKSNLIFRSEYSAENNAWDDPNDGLSCVNSDLSCGNGFAGSPATGWPCLSDTVCSGWGCFGHGRGMCQWGTQRWASNQGQLWKWIVNHYYNNDGNPSGNRSAYMTSPMNISNATPNPSQVTPGSSFTINVTAVNYAEIAHSQIMIGASLYSASTGYISDPANDTKVTLNPGNNSVSRPFVVPGTTPAGTYDLIVALWLDVDQNNSITGSDLPLVVQTYAGAVQVVTCSSDPITDWKGDYYQGMNFNTLIFSKNNPQPAGPGSWSDWGTNSPYPGCVPADQFSVRWTKTVSFPSGLYKFTVGSDDGARLYVDGILQGSGCNAWYDRPYTEGTCDVTLSSGNHTLVLEFYENGGAAVARLDWCQYPGNASNPSPTDGGYACANPVLSWSPASGASSYDVYLDGNLICTGITSTSCPTTVSSGTHSWYVVTRNTCGITQGPTWTFTIDTIPPANVGNTLGASKLTPGSVRLTWQAVPDASSYTVYRSSSPSGPWSVMGNTSALSFDDTNASSSPLYYRITARDACGNESG